MRLFKYKIGGTTRVVHASGSPFAGFGYVVSHPDDSEGCLGGYDTSPLGHFFPGYRVTFDAVPFAVPTESATVVLAVLEVPSLKL